MRLGYFGGSFDPPHRGHLTVARAARDHFALDRILLAPTGRQPLKPGGPVASFADRLHMTELLCSGEPGLEASALDAPDPAGGPNYTVDTLRRLRSGVALHPSSTSNNAPADNAPASTPELFAIVGADALHTLPHWREPQALLDLAQWIIVSRPGSPLSLPPEFALTPVQRARIHLLDGPADPISATMLRGRLRSGKDCAKLLSPAVLSFIRSRGLYHQPIQIGRTRS